MIAQQSRAIHFFVDPHIQLSDLFSFDEYVQGYLIFVHYYQQIQPEKMIETLK